MAQRTATFGNDPIGTPRTIDPMQTLEPLEPQVRAIFHFGDFSCVCVLLFGPTASANNCAGSILLLDPGEAFGGTGSQGDSVDGAGSRENGWEGVEDADGTQQRGAALGYLI